MIKAIIFDFDEMIHIGEELFSDWVVKQYNLSDGEIKKFFRNEFKLCRIGKLDTKLTLTSYLPRFGWKGGVEEFIQCWAEYGSIDQEIIELVKKLRNNGIKCILCTNNEKYRIYYYIKKYSLDTVFETILLSAELGFTKPEKKMLEKIVEVSDAKKDQILLCDDKDSFIEEADKFGFRTYKYTNLKDFTKFLGSLNVL